MLLAFIGLIALINGILGGVGGWFGFESLSLELILGWLFAPLAFLLGVPWEEATLAGSFIGQKLVVNEFVAYINLAPYIDGEQVVAATGQLMTRTPWRFSPLRYVALPTCRPLRFCWAAWVALRPRAAKRLPASV